MDRREQEWGIFAFGTAEGRLVAYNIFLDGNTYCDSHSVDSKAFVADFTYGVALTTDDRCQFSYANAFRSREFDGQDHWSRFGSITFFSCRLLF